AANTAAFTEAGSATSSATGRQRPEPCCASSATDSTRRAVAATRAPAESAASAIARPRPLEQPVTSHVCMSLLLSADHASLPAASIVLARHLNARHYSRMPAAERHPNFYHCNF